MEKEVTGFTNVNDVHNLSWAIIALNRMQGNVL